MSADRATAAYTTLRYEVADAIATITLDRPEALNALTVPLKVELLAAFRAVARDRSVRAVVLTGAGRAFCAGQDLKERLEPDAAPLAIELRERYNPIIAAMRALDQPIVGAINGVAAGAGAALAFACDIRLAAEGATFVLAFGRIGLVPDSGSTWFLPRLVGPAKAAELALVGETLSAADAERFGLVARVVPAGSLADEARATATRLAGLAPVALALTKRALDRSWSIDLDTALEDEAFRQGVAGATADHAEGIAAFLEKRPPRFSGE
jgi:2-(1,2-epoxy-1,2-dihydrophenyl)acetyl-CoA isomerase